jgi:TolA-binding protein
LGYQKFQPGHEKNLHDTQYWLGEVFEKCGRLDEAENAFADAQVGYAMLLGPNDPEAVDAACRLDRIRLKQN